MRYPTDWKKRPSLPWRKHHLPSNCRWSCWLERNRQRGVLALRRRILLRLRKLSHWTIGMTWTQKARLSLIPVLRTERTEKEKLCSKVHGSLRLFKLAWWLFVGQSTVAFRNETRWRICPCQPTGDISSEFRNTREKPCLPSELTPPYNADRFNNFLAKPFTDLPRNVPFSNGVELSSQNDLSNAQAPCFRSPANTINTLWNHHPRQYIAER